MAVVKVPEGTRFGFEAEAGDMWFAPDLDRMNFRELPAGTVLGWVREQGKGRLEAWDESGKEVGLRYFALRDGEIRTNTPVMPSMLTLDTRVIRQDCLGYLMERYTVPRGRQDSRPERRGQEAGNIPRYSGT